MRQKAFGNRPLPGPAGELERSPRTATRNSRRAVPTSKGEKRKRNGKIKGRDGKGEGKKERERADLRPGLGKCKGGNPIP